MSLKTLMIVLVLTPLVGFAQATTTPDFSPPPMVPAAPPPMPAPEPTTTQPGTPPPPGIVPAPGYVPGQQGKTGYPYSPYGQPKAQEKPGPEIGLMVSESLFGVLTAAGVTVLPYFLIFANGQLDPTLTTILMIAIFGLTPVAVSQTQVGIANGSRLFQIEAWIPVLIGIGAQALVLTIYYFANGSKFSPPPVLASGGVPPDQGAAIFLFIGSIGLVPLIQMAAINLFKSPKQGTFVASEPRRPGAFALAPPTIAPVVNMASGGFGGQAVLRGSF
ncbi:MAG: hypothetical protein Q8L48_34480 [Archangium sp.]|nr:hypothetical protein [Archangium sp.]